MEIWLNYGDTEIAMDIKAENLLQNINYQGKKIDDVLLKTIESIDAKHLNVCILEDDEILLEIAMRIGKSTDVTLYASKKIQAMYKEHDIKLLDEGIYDKDDTLLIAKASFDPLFGYSGVPTSIIRRDSNLMFDVIKKNNEPHAGVTTDALLIAYDHLKSFASKSIEVITDNNSIIDLIIDEPIKANQRTIISLNSFKVKTEKCKAIIIGSGRTYTLASALKALWNCTGILREESDVVLLAEGRDGLGSEALELVIKNALPKDKYVNGMEDVIFLNWAKTRYNISLVTSLPDYYMKMLNLRCFRSINHALRHIIDKNPKQKIMVVHDASKMLLT